MGIVATWIGIGMVIDEKEKGKEREGEDDGDFFYAVMGWMSVMLSPLSRIRPVRW